MLGPGTARVKVGVAGRSSIESENRSVAGFHAPPRPSSIDGLGTVAGRANTGRRARRL